MDPQDLLAAALDIEAHVASDGWDQPPLLFALVPTERIRAEEPELAAQLGVVDGFLAGIQWPEQITGAALVVERIVLPPEAEAAVADRPDAAAAAREHPLAQDMRIVVAVARDGLTMCALRLRGTDEESVLTGADLVPGLSAALLATFR
jgi:hypothetical protein